MLVCPFWCVGGFVLGRGRMWEDVGEDVVCRGRKWEEVGEDVGGCGRTWEISQVECVCERCSGFVNIRITFWKRGAF